MKFPSKLPQKPFELLERFARQYVQRYATRLKLHPAAGRRIPKELRPQNIATLANRFPRGLKDPGFAYLLEQIDDGPMYSTRYVQLFFQGEAAFQSAVEAIQNATHEILVQSYILRDDETGKGLLELLEAAADRGVKVKVLADAIGSWTTKQRFWDQMQARGIEARLFHPLLTHLKYFNIRDHRKIMVVDRTIAFTGGMNIGDEYGSLLRKRLKIRTLRDTHARSEGELAQAMAAVFEESWRRAGGSPLPELPFFPEITAVGPRVLVMDTRFGRGQMEAISTLVAIAAAARNRLWITNAYFAPRHFGIDVLTETARRGIDVRLLLPGVSDVPLVRHAGHGCFRELLENGVRIFEYQKAVLHAKTIVADDFISVVGSSNLDSRSLFFNAECSWAILDRTVAQAMVLAFENDLNFAREIKLDDWRARTLLHKAGDKLAHQLSPFL